MKKTRLLTICAALVILLGIFLGFFFYVKGKTKTEPIDYSKLSDEEKVMILRKNTVMITVGEYHGTGVIIEKNDTDIIIVTTYHLMEGYNQGIVTFSDNNVGMGNVLACFPEWDLCFLGFNSKDFDKEVLDAMEATKVDITSFEGLKKGDEVICVGSAVRVATNSVKGVVANTDYYVIDFDMNMLFLYMDAMEGMSGSGVYDSNLNLVGIVAGGSPYGEVVCVKLPEVIEKMEEIRNDKN